jgi:hypothetical protein
MALMERDAWTDERLDDLAAGIDKRFDQVDQRFDRAEGDIKQLRLDMKNGFDGIDKKLERMDAKFDAKFDSLQRNMLIGSIGLFGSIVGSVIAAVLALAFT